MTSDPCCSVCASMMSSLGAVLAKPSSSDPSDEFERIMRDEHVPLFTSFLAATRNSPIFACITELLQLRCQDVEWFSRAASLKIILQVCTQSCDMLVDCVRYALNAGMADHVCCFYVMRARIRIVCSKKCSTVLLEADTADRLVLFCKEFLYSLASTAQDSVRPVTHFVYSQSQHGLLTWLRLLWCMLLAHRKPLTANQSLYCYPFSHSAVYHCHQCLLTSYVYHCHECKTVSYTDCQTRLSLTDLLHAGSCAPSRAPCPQGFWPKPRGMLTDWCHWPQTTLPVTKSSRMY